MAVPFGRYQLLRKIASGGMGQVFLARVAGTQGFEKLLVIKRILPHLAEDEGFLRMFLDEARIAARLNHPNLVHIFELGEAEGAPYLAMEYVEGESLRQVDHLARTQQTPLPIGACLRIVADAAAGLDYAHQARDPEGKPLELVHRDVSPQNILVGFDGAVKLIDFGVAKAAGRIQHTVSGILKGKYPYMSPEQARSEAVGPRSDIFSLGVVLWELLTGKRLFKGENELATVRLVADCLVPPPSKVNAALPPELDGLVLRALAQAPEARYPTAGAFRMALEDFAVERHLPASPAHLAAFLSRLYAERLARKADPEAQDELHGPQDLEPSAPVSASTSRQAIRPVPAAEPQPALGAEPLPRTQEVSAAAPVPRRRRTPVIAATLGLAACALLGLGLWQWLTREAPAPPPPPAEATPAVSAPAVRLTLVTQPPGARVEIGGKEIGSTPVDYTMSPGAAPVVAAFSLPGFEPYEATLSPKDAPVFTVPLKKKASPKRGGANLEIKTNR